MTVEFDRSFERSLEKVTDQKLADKIVQFIENCEEAKTLTDLRGVKKLVGFASYYRFRIGDHRLGFEFMAPDSIRFILIGHRKDFYRRFP